MNASHDSTGRAFLLPRGEDWGSSNELMLQMLQVIEECLYACADFVTAGAKYLHEIYTKVDPAYTGKVLVPVLWDKKTATIVNNESSEIIRMFGSNSRQLGGIESNLYPQSASAEIDAVNAKLAIEALSSLIGSSPVMDLPMEAMGVNPELPMEVVEEIPLVEETIIDILPIA